MYDIMGTEKTVLSLKGPVVGTLFKKKGKTARFGDYSLNLTPDTLSAKRGIPLPMYVLVRMYIHTYILRTVRMYACNNNNVYIRMNCAPSGVGYQLVSDIRTLYKNKPLHENSQPLSLKLILNVFFHQTYRRLKFSLLMLKTMD